MDECHVSCKRSFTPNGSKLELKVHQVEIDFDLDQDEKVVFIAWDWDKFRFGFPGSQLRDTKYAHILAWLVPCRSSDEVYIELEKIVN